MLVWKKILWLRERVREQRAWIERCGGDLVGYIANYGDPGVPHVDIHGTPLTFKLTAEQQKLFDDLVPVGGSPHGGDAVIANGTLTFYKKHSGDGGTKIYEADHNRLLSWEQELAEWEGKNHAALQKAN